MCETDMIYIAANVFERSFSRRTVVKEKNFVALLLEGGGLKNNRIYKKKCGCVESSLRRS